MRPPSTSARPSTLAGLLSALLCISCGAAFEESDPDLGPGRSDLGVRDSGSVDPGADLGSSRDLGSPDLGEPTAPCETSCEFCRPRGPAITLSDNGQTPDPEWDGEKLLVAYSPNDEELVALLAVELDGTVLWDAPVPGSQDPRVAFDRDAGVGLMIFDRGLQWLGPDGRPVGLPERYGRFTNVTGEVAVTADGFLTMFAEFGGPLHFHRVGRVAEPPQMNVFDERGGTTPEHVIDEAGHASFIATSATDGSYGAIHRVGDSGPPELVADLGDRGRVVGFQSGPDGQFFVLRVAPPPARSLLVLEELDRAGALLGRNEFPSELAGSQLLRLGESLIFATRASTGDETLVCADGRDPSSFSTTTYTSERVTAGSPPRMTRVPRGFAVTWGTRGTVSGTQSMLQVYDCCVPE